MSFPDGRLADAGEILGDRPATTNRHSVADEWNPEMKAEGPSRCTDRPDAPYGGVMDLVEVCHVPLARLAAGNTSGSCGRWRPAPTVAAATASSGSVDHAAVVSC